MQIGAPLKRHPQISQMRAGKNFERNHLQKSAPSADE